MNFLQAHAAVKGFSGGAELRFSLVCSAVTATLDLYLRAHGALQGFATHVETLPFDSVAQRIRTEIPAGTSEVFLLLPWDLVPETNWRTGLPGRTADEGDVLATLAEHAALFARRKGARYLFLPAPIPPLMATLEATRSLESRIQAATRALGAVELPAQCFNLASYLEIGNPFATQSLGDVAAAVVAAALRVEKEPKKVLVTDLDNTLWHGVIGEDGVDGIAHAPEGRGFPFFIYQSLLKKLRHDGVILAAVSRNDRDLALAPFASGDMVLTEADFVAIIASYHSKSAQIEKLAQDLNLGLDSLVFIDDNPIELEEVKCALPAVEGIAFKHDPAQLPELLHRVAQLFGKAAISDDDRRRTEMYRTRIDSSVPSHAQGADLRSFLASLDMALTIRERVPGDHTRCLQLINKTNQFNINGRRFTESELLAVLEAGGHLIGATLDDRNGTHGEVIACLVNPQGTIEAFVMSCRVFQRRAEYAFTAWLATRPYAPCAFRYVQTERNEPARMFLGAACEGVVDGVVPFDAPRLRAQYADDLTLFRVVEA